jgi:hypothetical protein
MANINDILNKMRKAGKVQDAKGKGDLGEDAVIAICYNRMQKSGKGLLYQSYMYPYQSDRNGKVYTGNIKYENKDFVEYTEERLNDEIDVLYVTPYRVFVIEVKSYHARKLEVYDHWFNYNGSPVDKSPIAQAEKHARHLYHAIKDYLPDGNPMYIVPLVCFVDRCKVLDDRDDYFQKYIPISILDTLLNTINKNNVPLDYNIDLEKLETHLERIKVSIKRKF